MGSKSCTVVDYGSGNVFSVMHALRGLGIDAELTNDRERIVAAERVILPGVGAFGKAAELLKQQGIDEALHAFVETGRPMMGICVGMQLLMDEGHEFGVHKGLGLIQGTVDKIEERAESSEKLRIPVIGWHPLSPPHKGIFAANAEDGDSDHTYYFVHSFSVRPTDPDAVLATVHHAGLPVVAAVGKDNVMGVQFHPERSGSAGLKLLDRFMNL
ncbi:MAG: imidazole glycerol phosphate synthase subunit HisH [Halocynthiibacter sp.]